MTERSVRGYHAVVCVHVDTQSGCFRGEEASSGHEGDMTGP